MLPVWACANVNIDSLRSIWSDPDAPDSSRFQAMDAFYLAYSFTYPDSALALSNFHLALAHQKGTQQELLVKEMVDEYIREVYKNE